MRGRRCTNDFIELYNHGSAPVDLSGWSVQYASAAGTSWQATPLTGSIAAGGHYLVQEGAGSGGTTALPTPEASGNIAMSAASGKVALATVSTALACGATCSANASVRDFVGYGAANDFETAAAPGVSNTTADARNAAGADTDNNAADFTAGAPDPQNGAGGPPPVVITGTDPADGANDVPVDTNITVTFSGPANPTFTITCATSGAHEFTQSGGPTEFTLDPTTDFAQGESCTVRTGADDFSFTTVGIEGLRIHDIQGAQHRSPYEGKVVSGVPGVVTAASSNGIWVQDTQPDNDVRTSEGIFLFRPSARPPVGTAVTFSGPVQEFKPAANPENLTLTEMGSPTVTVTGQGTVPAPTIVGQGGRTPPNRIIDNDSTGDVDTNPMFDPQQDGIDFHESLEGMLVQFNNAVATGPTNSFGELSTIVDNGRNAGLRTPRGGVIVQANDFNPERFILDDVIGDTPTANTGDKLSSSIVAVGDYSFGNYKYYPLQDVTATGQPPARGHADAEVERAGDRVVQRREPRAERPAVEVRRARRHADQQPQGAGSRRRRGDPGQRRRRPAARQPSSPPA